MSCHLVLSEVDLSISVTKTKGPSSLFWHQKVSSVLTASQIEAGAAAALLGTHKDKNSLDKCVLLIILFSESVAVSSKNLPRI